MKRGRGPPPRGGDASLAVSAAPTQSFASRSQKHRRSQRNALWYGQVAGLRPPYRVLLCPDFVAAVLRAHVDARELLPTLMGGTAVLSASHCMAEHCSTAAAQSRSSSSSSSTTAAAAAAAAATAVVSSARGKGGGGAGDDPENHRGRALYYRKLQRIPECAHAPVLGWAECVRALVSESADRFAVATQDRALIGWLRARPQPVMVLEFLDRNAKPVLYPPTDRWRANVRAAAAAAAREAANPGAAAAARQAEELAREESRRALKRARGQQKLKRVHHALKPKRKRARRAAAADEGASAPDASPSSPAASASATAGRKKRFHKRSRKRSQMLLVEATARP